MNISRRQLIKTSIITAGTFSTGVLSYDSLATPLEENSSFDPKDWSSVRAQFKLLPEYVHISNFFLASLPLPVREAVDRHRKAFDENPYTYLEDNMFANPENMIWKKVCAAAAQYIEGHPDEIALTSSTTQGLAMIYNGLTLKPDQEILTSTQEWYTHDESMRLAVAKWGGHIRRIELYKSVADVSTDNIVKRIRLAITPKTKIVAMTWVHSGTGVRLPIQDIAAMLVEVNNSRLEEQKILLVVDGVHGFGCVDESVSELGCDFFASGTHKWILAPHGTGLIWARAENWQKIIPTIPTLMSAETTNAWRQQQPPAGPTQAAWVSPGGFFAYENQWATIEAFEFIKKIGRKRIADRVTELNGQLKEGLAKIPHITLHTPMDPKFSAGIVNMPDEIEKTLQVMNSIR